MTQLIAPNGKPSNLTPEQWKLVRTPQFKAWFGDWENDPENASKVVDENGEPLVVYHGSKQSINIFKKKKNTKQDNPNYVQGFWFFSAPIGNSLTQEDREYFYDEGSAEWMAKNWVVNSEGDSIAKVIRCFLNVRNPIEVDSYAEFLHWRNDNDVLNSIKNNERDGWFIHGSTTDGGLFRDDINVFNSNQIKLADGTNTTFDGSNPDIRFAKGGEVKKDFLKVVIKNVTNSNKYKGAYKQIFDTIEKDIVFYTPYGTESEDLIGNDFHITITPKPDQSIIEKISKIKNVVIVNDRYAEGGKTKRTMKRIKRGGITYGKSHAEGGIPVKNQSTGDMLEVEGGEGIVNKRSMASDKKVKLNGKEMTICEAVSQLNQLEGGVQFSCDDVSDRQFIEAMAKGGELERGTRTEKEHIQVLKDLYAKRITPKEASKRIAKDHLKEDSRYYSKLAKMEGKMADGGMSENLDLYIDTQNTKMGEYDKVTNLNTLKALEKNGFIEFNEKTGTTTSRIKENYYTTNKPNYNKPNIWLGYDLVEIKTKHIDIKSAVKPKFKFKEKEYFIGYDKGRNFLKFYVLKKGEEWDKYNSEEKMAQGGEIFDKETEDYLSELTKKFAKGGEVVADKTETINMKDFEGYADQYNGRKNKFFKATDEYQLLVNEGMDVKNNKDLPQEEKDKLLAELRDKAREAKSKLNEERKDFVDMREVKSPFYAPQLANGGKISKANKKAIESDQEGSYQIKFKSETLPSKGVDVKVMVTPNYSEFSFRIASRSIYAKSEYSIRPAIELVLKKLYKIDSSDFSIYISRNEKTYTIAIKLMPKPNWDWNVYDSVILDTLKSITSLSFYTKIKQYEGSETTPPPTEKEDDWTWRFKTEDELRAELGGDLHAMKDGSVFTRSMSYLLGKKIKETTDSLDAIFRINRNTYGGVEFNTEKSFGINNPEHDNEWYISSWMITDKPLEGEEVPPTEKKKEITEKDVQNEVFRWTEEKVKEKKDINERKYQTSNLIDWILLNQNGGSMVEFSELIALAKQSEKVNREMVRLANEGLPVDGFVMQLMYKKVLQLVEDIKAQIMLFVLFESQVKQELDNLVFHIKYLAELDTFDKDYILHIK